MSRRLNWIAAALILLLLLFGGYVGAYIGLSYYTAFPFDNSQK